MSVLVKVIEERAHWAEHHHVDEARQRRLVSVVRKMLLLAAAFALYLYHVEIVDAIQTLAVR